jgi:LysM repeat protein/phage baseplate assembly protein W
MGSPVISYISPTETIAGSSDMVLSVYGQNFDTNTSVSFAGSTLSATFIGTNQVQATVPSSMLANGTLGSATVSTTNLYGTSNATTFQVISSSTTSLNDLNSIVNGINTSSLTISPQAPSPYITTINNVETYVVQQNDTLQSIAANMLGDASQWMDIAFINNLRYPYISTDPLDYTGSNSTSTTLAANASVGSQTIYLNNLSQSLTVGCVLYFQLANLLTNGSLNAISEIHTIISITTNPYNYEVTVGLDSPLTNNYLSGTVISVLNTTNNTTSIVIQPGQTILIPSNIQSSSFIKLNGSASSDPNIYLGQDLLLDISGNLSGDSTGDLSGVSGVANLTQALKNRLSTELGELVYYPQYGNVALDYIGSVSSSALAILCNSKVSSTLMQDPRVNSISNITTTVTGDILTINVSLVINSMSSGITLNFILNQ